MSTPAVLAVHGRTDGRGQGLLSPELVAGIRRVKGLKHLGQQLGSWLTAEEGQRLVGAVRSDTLRKRDAAMLGLLLGRALRRSEVGRLTADSAARRTLGNCRFGGQSGHVRTAPVPIWVKIAIDGWMCAVNVSEGRLFRAIPKNGALVGQWRDAERCLLGRKRVRQACRA
jgi:site-specific recombinase XerC